MEEHRNEGPNPHQANKGNEEFCRAPCHEVHRITATGVRTSPGAACSAVAAAADQSTAVLSSRTAAPGDGRTPTLAIIMVTLSGFAFPLGSAEKPLLNKVHIIACGP